MARCFLLALLSYHPEKKVDEKTVLTVSLINGHPALFVNDDPTSFRKCLVALQQDFLNQVQAFTGLFFRQANIKALC